MKNQNPLPHFFRRMFELGPDVEIAKISTESAATSASLCHNWRNSQ